MAANNGTILIMNARSGELLAVASHPWYDPSKLDSEWNKLITDPESPLLNRASTVNTRLVPQLGHFYSEKRSMKVCNYRMDQLAVYHIRIRPLIASIYLFTVDPGLAETLQNGCPQSLLNLGRSVGKSGIYDVVLRSGIL